MPIIKLVPLPCVCKPPCGDEYGDGTIWECEKCKKQYEIVSYSDYRESGRYWKFLRQG